MLRAFVGLVSLLYFLVPLESHAQSAREIIQRGKAATAFVELPDKKKTGSAVCIHASGIVVTNHHVVKDLPKDAKVKLVFDSHLESPREVDATVVREDEEADLAILRVVKADKPFTFLPLGNDAELFETMKVTTFGYPFGKALAVGGQSYPEISVNQGQITALRMRDGKLSTVQLDAQLNPGNSGGPTTDDSGAIIGIVQAGVFATGVNFAIPVRRLRPLVENPEIIFEPPYIGVATKFKPVDLHVELVSILDSVDDAEVELEIRESAKPPRKFVAKPNGKNRYTLSFAPFTSKVANDPIWIPGTLTFSSGSVQGSFENETISIGTRSFQLSQLRTIEWGNDKVVPRIGSEVVDQIKGPTKLKLSLGSSVLYIELAGARRLEFTPVGESEPFVDYALIVKKRGTELMRQEGKWTVEDISQGQDEVQSFSLNGANKGNYTYSGNGKTRRRYMGGGVGMNTSDVQQDMDALWEKGNTEVTGPNGGPWKVQFKGAFSGKNVPQMTITSQGTYGPTRNQVSPVMTTITNGGKNSAAEKN